MSSLCSLSVGGPQSLHLLSCGFTLSSPWITEFVTVNEGSDSVGEAHICSFYLNSASLEHSPKFRTTDNGQKLKEVRNCPGLLTTTTTGPVTILQKILTLKSLIKFSKAKTQLSVEVNIATSGI